VGAVFLFSFSPCKFVKLHKFQAPHSYIFVIITECILPFYLKKCHNLHIIHKIYRLFVHIYQKYFYPLQYYNHFAIVDLYVKKCYTIKCYFYLKGVHCYDKNQDSCNKKHQEVCQDRRLRRMPDILPVCLQDILRRCKPAVRKDKRQKVIFQTAALSGWRSAFRYQQP